MLTEKLTTFAAAAVAAYRRPKGERKGAITDLVFDPVGARVLMTALLIASAVLSVWLDSFSLEPMFPFTAKWLFALLTIGWTWAEIGLGLAQKKLTDYVLHLLCALGGSLAAAIIAVSVLRLPGYLGLLWGVALIAVLVGVGCRTEWELNENPTVPAEREGIVTSPALPSGNPAEGTDTGSEEPTVTPAPKKPTKEFKAPDWLRGLGMSFVFLVFLKIVGAMLAFGR